MYIYPGNTYLKSDVLELVIAIHESRIKHFQIYCINGDIMLLFPFQNVSRKLSIHMDTEDFMVSTHRAMSKI